MKYILLIIQIITLLWLLRVTLNHRRLKSAYNSFMKGKDAKTLENSIIERFNELEALEELTNKNKQDILTLSNKCGRHFQKFAVVKYDAFEGDGDCKSFALTMLDEDNNGWILNTMHSGGSCYNYIKEVAGAKSLIALTKEEEESLKKAVYQELYEPKENTKMPE